eukprot:TRINITY_DN7095_c0_g3_i1.p1 TRINITY_DN7095_c0_g3~~TRINITY_DN7095_c0_g3_i1.p1  ORF type:complete len:258 (-),score=55.64 TRINITY_DN7095_c0_g3_i1:42-815(-)
MLWTLASITDANDGEWDEDKIISIAMENIGNKKTSIKIPSIRILGNICAENDSSTNHVISQGGLNALVSELQTEERSPILLELCWALSNISSGPSLHVAQLLNAGAVDQLVSIGLANESFKTRKEAAIALANACGEASEYQIGKIVEAQGLKCLTEALKINDTELIVKALDAIDFILFAGEGGVDDDNKLLEEFNSLNGKQILDELLMHPNEQVFKKANVLTEKYYRSNMDLLDDPLATVDIECLHCFIGVAECGVE